MLDWSGMVHLPCTDGLIDSCAFWLLYSPLAAFSALVTLFSYPYTPHSFRSWIAPAGSWAMAMDIERISLQGRKWIPCLREVSLACVLYRHSIWPAGMCAHQGTCFPKETETSRQVALGRLAVIALALNVPVLAIFSIYMAVSHVRQFRIQPS